MTAAHQKLSTFPAFFRVSGRTVVVVGAGDEAFAKARLLANTDARIVVLAEVPQADFARFIADNGLVLVHAPFSSEAIADATLVFAATSNDRHYVNFTLDQLEKRLDTKRFQRVHRAAIVNLDHATALRPGFAGTYRLTLDDAERTEVPVSRARARELRGRLGA